MTPFGLSTRITLPPSPDGISYDPATQTSTLSGAPISGLLLKSWGENGDVNAGLRRQDGLAEAWA